MEVFKEVYVHDECPVCGSRAFDFCPDCDSYFDVKVYVKVEKDKKED